MLDEHEARRVTTTEMQVRDVDDFQRGWQAGYEAGSYDLLVSVQSSLELGSMKCFAVVRYLLAGAQKDFAVFHSGWQASKEQQKQ